MNLNLSLAISEYTGIAHHHSLFHCLKADIHHDICISHHLQGLRIHRYCHNYPGSCRIFKFLKIKLWARFDIHFEQVNEMEKSYILQW